MREQKDSHKTNELRERIKAIAHQRRRFGFRRIHDLLRMQGVEVNHKRVYRLYAEQKLSVKRCKKVKRPERAELVPEAPNQVWSIDFVMGSLANGRKLKWPTIADDKTHECVDIAVDHGVSGLYVTRILGWPLDSEAMRKRSEQTADQITSGVFMGWMHTNAECLN